ncbi:MAG TPA: high frequency lysogenization protein HflD [Rhodanobacteraceae bacterium]|nr:high frequency lysogenization protein HflD [Rhodanobacteraceae bacterium]
MNEARVIALAGLFQALNLVRSLATEGDCDPGELETCMASIFKLESESAADIYGGIGNVREGLRALIAQIDGERRDPVLLRIVFAILRLERSLHRHPAAITSLQEGLQGMQRQLVHFGPTHPTVLARAADLYAENLSGLRPRVMVIGNPLYLHQPAQVQRIRALLLAGVRAAVLWRQLGGRRWHLLLRPRREAMLARGMLTRTMLDGR